jgi:subtilase family serine protease
MIHTLFTHAKTFICLLTMLLVMITGQSLQAQSSREVTVVVKTPGQATRRVDDVDIKLYARPITDGAKTEHDIQLKVKTIQPIQSVSTGRASAYKVTVELPENITREEYGLWAYIDAGNTVTESNLGAVDLVIQFGNVTLPQRIVSGGKGVARFPVTITNKGDLAAVRQQRIDIKIVARPATAVDESQDVTIATAANESIGNMEPNESVKVVLIGEFPGQLPVQSYNIIAVADSSNAVNERDENNNTAQMPDTIAVTGQNIDLLVDLNNVQLPKGIVSGSEKQITVPIKITNAGNLGFDLDQTVDVKIVARPALNIDDDSEDVLLAFSQGNSLAQLGPGSTMEMDIEGKLPPTMAKGTYTMRVIIDPTNRVKEANESNNMAMLLEPISVLAKVVDLDGQLMEARAPRRVISGESPLLVMPLRITNSGSVPFSADAPAIDIKLVARPDDALDQTGDVVLNQIKDRPISGLMPGQSMIVNLDTALPANMQHGRFKLIAIVDASNKIEEADETNNTPEYEHTMAVEKPFVDLVAGIVTLRPARAIVSGSDHVLTVPVKVANKGNVRPNANVPVNIRVSGRPLGALDKTSNDVELGVIKDVNLGDLEPGTEKLFQAQAKFPARMPAGKYVLVAQVDSDAVVVEPDDENNYAVAPVAHALEIAAPRVDLGAQIVNLNLPTSVIAGQGTELALPVKIINQGNIALPSDQYVDIKVSARRLGTDGDKDIDLALDIDKPVASLAPGDSLTFTSTVKIPSNVESGKYLLVAHVDATNKLKEEDEANNILTIAPGQAFDVVAPVIDLVADIVNPQLPSTAVAGYGPSATVPVQVTNAGNVATASDVVVDIKVFAKLVDGDKLIEVSTLASQPIGGLQPGLSSTFNTTATIPTGAAQGKYVLVARVDTSEVVAESNETNNTATTASANSINVASPFVELALGIEPVDQPAAVIAGHSQPIAAILVITNEGNIPVADQTKLRGELYCTTGKDNVLLKELADLDVSGLGAGKSVRIKVSGSFPENLPAGRYVLGAKLANTADAKQDNDIAVIPMASSINVAAPFVDLAINIDSAITPTQAIAGHSQPVTATLRVTNMGNIATNPKTKLRISMFCSSDNGQSKTELSELGEVEAGNLQSGQSILVNAKGSFPATLTAGRYVLGASLLNSRAAGDEKAANDMAIQVAADAVNVVRPFVDLALTLDPVSLPGSVIAGYARPINLPLRLTNQGNIAMPESMQVNLRIHAVNTGEGGQRVAVGSLEGVQVGSLAAGATVMSPANVVLPATLPAGQYNLTAEIDPTTAQGDTDPANNRVATVKAHAIDVSKPFIDIAAVIVSPSVPAQVIAGHGPAFEFIVRLTNQGNVPLPADQKLSVSTYAVSTTNKALATRIDQQNVNVNGLGAGSSVDASMVLLIPSSVSVGEYGLRVQVEPVGDALVETSRENNVAMTTATQAIKVVAPFVDLVGQFDSARLPRQIVAGHASDVTVPIHITNQGNIALNDKAAIGVKLFARPLDRKAQDIVLGTLSDQSLAGLASGSVRTLEATVKFPPAMGVGRYLVGLDIDTASQVTESDENNNNQLADQGLAMQVDAPRYDLIGSLETVRPSGGIILEAQKVSVYVKIANRGNIPLDAKQTVDVMLYARPVSLGKLPDMDLQLGRMASLDVSNLAPGLERTFREEVMFSTTNMPTDDYVIVAKIDSTDLLREVDETNNIAKAEDRVIALGRRFRIKNMPVPFDSDGPRRYMVNGITIQYKGVPADPSVEQLKALELKLTKSYAGLVAQRYEEESQRMTVGELTEVKDTYLYRSAVRVLCARIADHLETVGKGSLSVHPAYDQIDIKGEDLRPNGQTGLTIVIEKTR